ncbi:MAG: HNH endonuclease [Synechococcaceae cyanobacterium SM2_3_1]|nr:HNH endonuclease [Synechococcaceae cyanobacterium SM2_3_1]
MSTISGELRSRIFKADSHRCCYCQTSEANSGIPLTFDHIHPRSKGGATVFENLCLACRPCNEYKSDAIEGLDPVTGSVVALFHARQEIWNDHFTWSSDGTRVEGITPIGRATVIALRMNHGVIVAARSRWVSSGWHPPQD